MSKKIHRKTIDLDISSLKFNDNGIINFQWPIDNKKTMLTMNCLIKSLKPIISNKNRKQEFVFLRIFLKWFLSEVLRYYEADVVSKNFKKKKIILKIPKTYKYLNSIYHQKKLKVNLFLKNKSGPLFGKKIPLFLKKILKELKWNGLKDNILINFNNELTEVLCIEPSSLAIKNARENGRVARYSSLTEWFTEIPKVKIIKKNKKNYYVNNIVLNLIAKSFEEANVKFSKNSYNYFDEWLTQAANFFDFHLKTPLNKEKIISKEVWFGSGCSSIWNVMLIEKLRKFGCKIITHDHGSGGAYTPQLKMHLTEYLNTDCFVTFDEFNRKIRTKLLNKKYSFGLEVPKIKSINKSNLNNKNNLEKSKLIKKNFLIKKVMYVGTAFHGEGARLRPIFHDMTYFDWQVRLLSFFKKKSIDLIYKPHPEGKTRPPEKFSEYFGFRTNNDLFENISEDFDAYLIDFAFSSTTQLILKSHKPVIFINLGFPEILYDAKKLIKKRCYYLDATYDKNSRLNINWNTLGKILNNKNHNFDMAFPNLYFKNIL